MVFACFFILQANLFYIFASMFKKFLYLSFLFLIVLSSNGQEERTLGLGSPGESGDLSESAQVERNDSIEPRLHSWTLTNQFSKRVDSYVDTATINFHNYNPIFKKSISNNYLGFLGAPYESNIFFDRERSNHFYFMRNLNAYYRASEDIQFFNTTTPYSSLQYSQGNQGTRRTEQMFNAFYTQNIDSVTNLGFRYNAIKNKSQYVLQESTHSFLNFFVSRNSERYNGYLSVVSGNNDLLENGGIISDRIDVEVPAWALFLANSMGGSLGTNNTSVSPYDLNVNLPTGVELNNKSLTLFTSHEYLMGRLPVFNPIEEDSTAFQFEPRYSAQYSVEFNRYNRHLIERSVIQSFFDTTLIQTGSHTDSASFSRFSQIFQLNAFEDQNRRFSFAKRAFIENEIVQAVHPLPYGQRKYNYSNVYAGGEISNTNDGFMNWSALARFAILGRNLGDAIVKGTLEMPIVLGNDTSTFYAQAWYSDISADIFQEHWFSNHFQWENDFRKQHEVVLRGSYLYPRYRASAGASYVLFSNYLYNDEQALPAQYSGEFSVLSAWLNKDFSLGRFHWSNKVVWQAVANDAVLRLPALSLYSNFYYSHYLFQVMKIQLGADIYYHTPFLSNKYEPSTTRFYLQNEMQTGGYPVINLYANAKLKRTSAFVHLLHANSMFKFGEFFSVPYYPIEQMAFRFGFVWTFYD